MHPKIHWRQVITGGAERPRAEPMVLWCNDDRLFVIIYVHGDLPERGGHF